MVDKFKNASGRYYTLGLFYETTTDRSSVLYTLKDYDHEGYPSLYKLFIEASDPTEYSFALSHLGSWEHWQILSGAEWFKPYADRWRKELEVKVRAAALQAIRATASSESKEAFQANKYLLSGNWQPKAEARRRGRPSKDEIKAEANRMAQSEQQIDNDLARIKGLN